MAIHGHFYQPARHDPANGHVPLEPAAAPWHDWNERVTDESYEPNVERDNLRRIGWDLGPAIATWLRRERPDLHDAIVRQDDGHNGMAMAYHHAILPLASARDRRTEIRWGLRDFELRFGRRPSGLWLPETAVDLPTLRICAEEGVGWTLLAPWQAAGVVETGRPYRVDAAPHRSIAVLFFDAELSASVSFDSHATEDADRFASQLVMPRTERGGTVVIATDGELYGHHQRFRELFLERLVARADGYDAVSPGAIVDTLAIGRLQPMTIRERTSWSCHHGIARWAGECGCAGDGAWKHPLRQALDRLAGGVDAVTQAALGRLGIDAWEARDRYVDVASEFMDAHDWAAAELVRAGKPNRSATRDTLLAAMRAQASRLQMFASDGWYWAEPGRTETAAVLSFATHAARTADAAFGSHLERTLDDDL